MSIYSVAPAYLSTNTPEAPATPLSNVWVVGAFGALACTALAGTGLILYANAAQQEKRETATREHLARYIRSRRMQPPATYSPETVPPSEAANDDDDIDQDDESEADYSPDQRTNVTGPAQPENGGENDPSDSDSDAGSEAGSEDAHPLRK